MGRTGPSRRSLLGALACLFCQAHLGKVPAAVPQPSPAGYGEVPSTLTPGFTCTASLPPGVTFSETSPSAVFSVSYKGSTG